MDFSQNQRRDGQLNMWNIYGLSSIKQVLKIKKKKAELIVKRTRRAEHHNTVAYPAAKCACDKRQEGEANEMLCTWAKVRAELPLWDCRLASPQH